MGHPTLTMNQTELCSWPARLWSPTQTHSFSHAATHTLVSWVRTHIVLCLPPKKQRNQKRICLFRRKIRFPNAKLLCFPTQWVLNPSFGWVGHQNEEWECVLSTKPGCDAFYIANRTFVLAGDGGGRFGVWNPELRNEIGSMGLSNNVLEIFR